MRRGPTGLVAVATVAAALLTGCGQEPEQVPGQAAPITAPTTAPGTATATGPTGSPTVSAPPVPTSFGPFEVTAHGVTARLPVPTGWTRTRNEIPARLNTDLTVPEVPGLVLRIDVIPRGAESVRAGVLALERTADIADYRRTDLSDVPGVGEDAVDWSFTSTYQGIACRTVNRQLALGPGGVAVLFRAPIGLFDRYRPVWERAVADLTVVLG